MTEKKNMVSYIREFELSISHFNGETEYTTLQEIRSGDRVENNEFLELLRNIHGHDLVIVVQVVNKMATKENWLLDDEHLECVVMSWNNKNLSVHKDFMKDDLRATTENIASVMVEKLMSAFRNSDSLLFTVTVHEGRKIRAVASSVPDDVA